MDSEENTKLKHEVDTLIQSQKALQVDVQDISIVLQNSRLENETTVNAALKLKEKVGASGLRIMHRALASWMQGIVRKCFFQMHSNLLIWILSVIF